MAYSLIDWSEVSRNHWGRDEWEETYNSILWRLWQPTRWSRLGRDIRNQSKYGISTSRDVGTLRHHPFHDHKDQMLCTWGRWWVGSCLALGRWGFHWHTETYRGAGFPVYCDHHRRRRHHQHRHHHHHVHHHHHHPTSSVTSSQCERESDSRHGQWAASWRSS